MNYLIRTEWWKWLTAFLLIYTVIGGLLFPSPALNVLNETIRAVHFHVPMWFGMIFLFTVSMIYAVKSLSSINKDYDTISETLAEVGIVYGILGLLTGMFWANFIWNSPWSNDPKQNSSAICMLIYAAYFVLRGSIGDDQQRTRMAGVYNIFAFSAMLPLLFIIPRMTDSLHPGNGGNPAFGQYDMDNNLRIVFYPAVFGWTLLGFWIASLKIRISRIKYLQEDD